MILPMATRLAFCVAALAACRGAGPTARDRLLAEITGGATIVVVADGAALADPRGRAVLDVVAAQWPPGMGCVVEAALAADQAALAVDAGRNVTALLATAAAPICPALSQRAPGLWVATIGAPAAAPGAGATSVLDDDRFARARRYLRTAPIAAVVLGVGDARAIATAQPQPLEAWLAIDTSGAPSGDALEQAVKLKIDQLQGDPQAAGLAARLSTSRAGDQVVVRLDHADDVDLAAAARTMIGWADPHGGPRTRPDTACADPARGGCLDAATVTLRRLRDELLLIVSAGQAAPVVDSGAITGLRLAAAVPHLGLDAGDLVVAVDGRLVSSREMFARLLPQGREVRLLVRRGAADRVLRFVER